MENPELLARLKAMEERLEEALGRLDRLEGKSPVPLAERPVEPPPPPPPPPPPVQIPAPVSAPISTPAIVQIPSPVEVREGASNPDDLEYKFGINGLLRGGAAVILCAFLFLVGLMISRGYVTRQIQFGAELALCLAFVGIGLWKRDEREDFGQIMAGIGSFGLYAVFAECPLPWPR